MNDACENKDLTHALKVLAACLKHTSDAYAAYRLRRIRYRLLRNNGIVANMTYPRMNAEIKTNVHFKPVRIRYMGRMSGAGSAPVSETFGSPNTMTGKRRHMKYA
jgi:hypothetical protein